MCRPRGTRFFFFFFFFFIFIRSVMMTFAILKRNVSKGNVPSMIQRHMYFDKQCMSLYTCTFRIPCLSFFLFFFFTFKFFRGAWWLSGRVSDSGARSRGFETYRHRVVSLSKTLYSPKVLVNYPGSDGSVPTWWKIVDWDVKPQHKQTKLSNFNCHLGW